MKLEHINFKYKNQKQLLLKNVSLSLNKEKLNVLIGTNGAGKTTLLDIISGLHRIKRFETPFKKSEIVYQLQGIYMPHILKGKDLLRLILKSDSPTRSFNLLESEFREKLSSREQKMMDKLRNVKFGDMSVGERRWIVIRAITELNRKLYIFDEPTAGVDPASRPLIIEALEKLIAKEDVYVLMSTHILHELAHVDCQLNFLHDGKISFEGNYQSFLNENGSENPDTAFQNFLESVTN